jgi:4-hydroxy-3-methylbut-2-en-1-yl diphosphate synthase IspG/GcpE
MRQTLRTLCRISFSQAIAEKAMERIDVVSKMAVKGYYRDMFQKACTALRITPGNVSIKDQRTLNKVLKKFTEKLEWDKGRNIHILLNFSIELLERLYKKTNDPIRKKSIVDLIDSEMRIYNYFDEPDKDDEYIQTGLLAVSEWERIVENS